MKLKGRKEKMKNTVKKAKINKNGVMKGISNGEHTPKYYDAYIKYPIIIINDNIKTADNFIFEVWDDFLDSLYEWIDKHAFEDSFEDYALMGIKRDIDRLPYYYDKTDENYHCYEETNEKYSDFVNHTYDEIRGRAENIEKANMLKEAKKIIEGGKAEQMLIKLGFIRGAMGANCIFLS